MSIPKKTEREVTITRRILRWLTEQGHYAEKRHGSVYGKTGEPDLYVLLKSLHARGYPNGWSASPSSSVSPESESVSPESRALPRIESVFAIPAHFEVKVPGQHSTPLQLRRQRQLRAAGALVAEVHSLEEVQAVISEAYTQTSRASVSH